MEQPITQVANGRRTVERRQHEKEDGYGLRAPRGTPCMMDPTIQWDERPPQVKEWCDAMGLDNPRLLAFAFDSPEEVIETEVPALVEAWRWCRVHANYARSVTLWPFKKKKEDKQSFAHMGHNGMCEYLCTPGVRKLMARGRKVASKRTYNPRPTVGQLQPGEKMKELQNKKAEAAAMVVDLSMEWRPVAGIARAITGESTMLKYIRAQKTNQLMNSEAVTMMRAVMAWRQWEEFMKKSGEDPLGVVSPAAVECWVNDARGKTGPLQRFHRLKWLWSNAAAPLPMEQVAKPVASPGKEMGRGQAVIAEPVMLKRIVEMVNSEQTDRRWVPALCVAFVMGTAVTRFRHMQRSRFFIHRSEGYWCKCAMGKAKNDVGVRTSFLWFAPKTVIEEDEDLRAPIEVLHNMWADFSSQAGVPLQYLAFDGVSGRMLSLEQFHVIIRDALWDVVVEEQAEWISSYSFRRIGATISKIVRLSEIDEFVFGGWTATEGSSRHREMRQSMPTRYNAKRASQEELLKIAVWKAVSFVATVANYTMKPSTWDDLEHVIMCVIPEEKGIDPPNLLEKFKAEAKLVLSESFSAPAYGNDEANYAEKRFTVRMGSSSKKTSAARQRRAAGVRISAGDVAVNNEQHQRSVRDLAGTRQEVPKLRGVNNTRREESREGETVSRHPQRLSRTAGKRPPPKLESDDGSNNVKRGAWPEGETEVANVWGAVPAETQGTGRPMRSGHTNSRAGYVKGEEIQKGIVRCNAPCTLWHLKSCGKVCWLPVNHNNGLSCDHACRECWSNCPIDIRAVRDARGMPAFPEEMEQRPGAIRQDRSEPSSTKVAQQSHGVVATTGNDQWKRSSEGSKKLHGKVAVWFVAKTKEGSWLSTVHVAVKQEGNQSVPCGIKFVGRMLKVFKTLQEVPVKCKLCTTCFDSLQGHILAEVVQTRPELLPAGRARLLSVQSERGGQSDSSLSTK